MASGRLGVSPRPDSEGLYGAILDVLAPAKAEVAPYTVRCGSAVTWFSATAAAKPIHTLTVQVTERDSKAALEGVEIRLGPFHGRTGEDGRAELHIAPGDYQLQLWRTAHIADPTPVKIGSDASIELTMLHVPEEHPDARWVR